MWRAPGFSSGSAAGKRLVVKLIVVGPGCEAAVGCMTKPLAQITGQHGNARHG
jgi:hypothetical protein